MTTPNPASPDPTPDRAEAAAALASTGLADSVDRVAAATVGLVTRRRGVNAGLGWQPGLVVTCASAIGRASRVAVVTADGETRDGEVRGVDPTTDVAVIAVATDALAVPPVRATTLPRVGDVVFATGRNGSGMLHASFGHIGAVGGPWRTWRGGAVEQLVRLDGGLYPGLGGAPVGNAAGEVVGIASAMLSRHHGVVLPLATLERVVAHLLAHGTIRRGYIGVIAQPVTLTLAMAAAAASADSAGAAEADGNAEADRDIADASTTAGVSDGAAGERTGLLIAGLGADGPAAKGGVLVGDIIVGTARGPVTGLDDLRAAVDAVGVGSPLALTILRGGQPVTVEVVIGAREPASRRC